MYSKPSLLPHYRLILSYNQPAFMSLDQLTVDLFLGEETLLHNAKFLSGVHQSLQQYAP